MVMVGSASFNLLMVTAISIMSADEFGKKITNFRTFMVTFFFSCFAYLWMFLVLYVITPAEVTFAEAILTFLWYPVMIIAVWLVDVIPEQSDDVIRD